MDWNLIDWEDPNASVADHFRVHEVLWLPSWRIYHVPSDAEKAEAAKTALAMDAIRKLVAAGMSTLGVDNARVSVEDAGALPFVIAARLEADAM